MIQTQEPEKVEVAIEKQEKREVKLLGSQRRIKGHTLFEYNQKTGELNKAEIEQTNYNMLGFNPREPHVPVARTRVVTKDDCLYFQALNLANASKKLINAGFKRIV